MDQSTWLLGASFLLYALYVLLPIVPAVVIFKLFPNSSITVGGPLQNLTINATGAFAAYIATVLIGSYIVNRIDQRIHEMTADMTSPAWQIIAPIELRDRNGQTIKTPESLIRDLKVLFEPDLITRAYPRVYVRVPLEQRERWPIVQFAIPGFRGPALDLNRVLSEGGATQDGGGHKLLLKAPIVLEQLPEQLIGKELPPTETHVLPMPEGGPPAASR
jgi:hypothetical protein